MYLFPTTATIHYHKFVAEPRNVFCSQSWRPEVRNQGVSEASLPLVALEVNPSWFLQLSVAVGIPWLPWLLATSLQSLPLFSHRRLLSVCHVFSPVCVCLSYQDTYHWIYDAPQELRVVSLHLLNLIISAKTPPHFFFFLIRLTLMVSEIRIQTYPLRIQVSTHLQKAKSQSAFLRKLTR